jgi:hypothetical protein
MNCTARRETKRRQAVHKLIASLHSKRYRPSDLLIHRQNSYAPRSRRRSSRREAQYRESVKKVIKKIYVQPPVKCNIYVFTW